MTDTPRDRVQTLVEEIMAVLRHAEGLCEGAQSVMRKHGYRFERFPRDLKEQPPVTDGERWESLAFSLYSDLVEMQSKAEGWADELAALLTEREPPTPDLNEPFRKLLIVVGAFRLRLPTRILRGENSVFFYFSAGRCYADIEVFNDGTVMGVESDGVTPNVFEIAESDIEATVTRMLDATCFPTSSGEPPQEQDLKTPEAQHIKQESK